MRYALARVEGAIGIRGQPTREQRDDAVDVDHQQRPGGRTAALADRRPRIRRRRRARRARARRGGLFLQGGGVFKLSRGRAGNPPQTVDPPLCIEVAQSSGPLPSIPTPPPHPPHLPPTPPPP